jgi:enterochelin esterase family protein
MSTSDTSRRRTANPAAVKNLGAVLAKYGVHHQLRESPGGHTWINWRRRVPDILPLLFHS